MTKKRPVTVALCFVTAMGYGFTQQSEKETISGVQPIVNGSVHPELVPDEAALRVLFIAVAEPETAPPEDLQRLRNKVSRMRLSEPDMQVFIRLMAAFHKGRTLHEANIQAIPAQSATGLNSSVEAGAKMIGEQNAITALALDTFNSLLVQLSPDGAAKLRDHLNYVKTRIRIIPPPQMAHNH